MKNILVFVSELSDGGITNLLKSLFLYIDHNKFQIDIVTYSRNNSNADYFVENKCNVLCVTSPTLNYFKFYSDINKIFRVKKYDVVHSHNMLNNGFILKIAKQNGVKTRICHSHASKDFKEGIIFSSYKKYLKRLIVKNSTLLLACSDLAGKYLYDTEQFKIFRNSIDADLFSFNIETKERLINQYKINSNDIILGAIGMMWGVKNHKFILEIMNEIINVKKLTHFKLVLCGDGILRNELEGLVTQYGLENNVIFTGWVKNSYDYYSFFDIYLMPSLSEGFPLSLIEAQAAGCLCIVSDTISHATKLTNRFEFCSIDKNELDSWVRCIINRVENHCRFNEIEGSKFDSKINVKKLESLYNGDI